MLIHSLGGAGQWDLPFSAVIGQRDHGREVHGSSWECVYVCVCVCVHSHMLAVRLFEGRGLRGVHPAQTTGQRQRIFI